MPRFNPYKLFHGIHIPDAVLGLGVSLGAKVCYGVLAKMAGKRGVCWPRQSTIAESLMVGERQAMRYLDELEEFGLIERKQIGQGRPNRYYFLSDKLLIEPEEPLPEDDPLYEPEDGPDLTDLSVHVRPDKNVTSNLTQESGPSRKESQEKSHADATLASPVVPGVSSQEETLAVAVYSATPQRLFSEPDLPDDNERYGNQKKRATAFSAADKSQIFHERFWPIAWLKVGGPAHTLKSWCKVVKSQKHAESIIQAAIIQGPLLLQQAMQESRTPLHPSTWLNQGRYDDDVEHLRRSVQVGSIDKRTINTVSSINGAIERAQRRREDQENAAR